MGGVKEHRHPTFVIPRLVLGTQPRDAGRMRREGVIATYIMARGRNGTLYLGVTGDLWRWVRQHKQGEIEGFSKTCGCKRLVWFESFQLMVEAIQREKTMKGWPRAWKLNVIEASNPEWRDLHDERWGLDLDDGAAGLPGQARQ
jgi:putative endonuclease